MWGRKKAKAESGAQGTKKSGVLNWDMVDEGGWSGVTKNGL